MAPKKLSESEVSKELDGLPGWSLQEGKLVREFTFSDFTEAFAFMTELAMLSERLNHHPEWFNVYNKLKIELSTHDVDGLSDKDLEWAIQCNQRFNQSM